jgi:mannose-6-phosphate isomerase
LKILAAERALSIQVHPSREQARAGYAAEDAAGIERGAADRNYRDDNHKPELICALTTFDALCGFRPVEATLALLDRLDVAELGFVRELLGGPDPLRAATAGILEHPDPGPVVRALAELLDTSGDPELDGVRLAARDYPGDVGVVLGLLLNHVRLEPGEALFLPAGNVHAYLQGVGVEIMANSDNVLRCGLTSKHVDVPAVLAVTDFTALAEPRWPSLRGSYDVPVADFRLVRVPVEDSMALDDLGPLIVLCTEGSLDVGGVPLAPGRAAFVPAADPVTLSGAGVAFVAGVGMLG